MGGGILAIGSWIKLIILVSFLSHFRPGFRIEIAFVALVDNMCRGFYGDLLVLLEYSMVFSIIHPGKPLDW